MAYLHCRRLTRVQTRIRIQNLMASLYCAEHVHIAQTKISVPTPNFCIGQESESVSIPECVSGSVNEPYEAKLVHCVIVVTGKSRLLLSRENQSFFLRIDVIKLKIRYYQ